MDPLLLPLRVLHIGSAMIWFGGAIIGSFFLVPTADALGKAGQPFMDHLLKRRRLGIVFPVVAAITIASGAALYWRDSGGLQAAWITSPTGIARSNPQTVGCDSLTIAPNAPLRVALGQSNR